MNDELYHFGIKGMKWGVRRYQNKDGTYTAAGKKRRQCSIGEAYNRLKNTSVNNYAKIYKQRNKKLSDEDAKKLAEKRIELTKKIIIGTAVVGGAVAAAYGLSYVKRNYLDDTIKAGTTMQTIHADPGRLSKGEAFYTAFTESDKNKYIGLFGEARNPLDIFGTHSGEMKYRIQATAEKDIKVASTRHAQRVYEELMLNNPKFSNLVDQANRNGIHVIGIKGNERKSDYEKFNTLHLMSNKCVEAQKIFYAELKKRGYGAVTDVNDRKYSGFNTRAAIVFDRDNVSSATASKLDRSSYLNTKNKEEAKLVARSLASPVNAAAVALAYGRYKLSKYDNDVTSGKYKLEEEEQSGKKK